MKRAFDLLVGGSMLLALLPLLLLMAAGIGVLEGRPVLYVSRRRLNSGPAEPIVKFRTMRRDADRIANRDTVPIVSTRFLNLPITSPLYTPIGRVIERLMLTEMPQLLHVLAGRMSVVGNRPLPDNVVASLGEEFPQVEDRFLTPGGLTGPVQLVGRDLLSDQQRLAIEIAYCDAVLRNYSPLLDLRILAYTVLAGFSESARFTSEEVLDLLARHGARLVREAPPRRLGKPAAPEPDQEPPETVPAVHEGSGNR
nr:sugar transferase [Neoroseomonas soli]